MIYDLFIHFFVGDAIWSLSLNYYFYLFDVSDLLFELGVSNLVLSARGKYYFHLSFHFWGFEGDLGNYEGWFWEFFDGGMFFG